MESLNGWGLRDNIKVLWSNVAKANVWLIWKERSDRDFKAKFKSFVYQLTASDWGSITSPFVIIPLSPLT